MAKTLTVLLAMVPVAVFAAPDRLGFDPSAEPEKAASAYIAPENMVLFRMRMPDGTYYEFEHDFDRPQALYGPGKWRGRIKGEDIRVSNGAAGTNRVELLFRTGRLVSFRGRGAEIRFPYAKEREATGGPAPYHFDDGAPGSGKKGARKSAAIAHKMFAGKWKKSGRLSWPYPNPNENGCLYASLAMLGACLFFMRRKAAKIAGAALFAAAAVALTATASRGSALALAAGLLPAFAMNFKRLVRSKAFWAGALCLVALVAVWFGTHDSKLWKRGFGEGSWSNQVRLDMWKAAPAMMVEAPGGWDFSHVGRSYMDWHQPLEVVSLPGSLMNDHLTRMVGYGWTGRFFYVFAWAAAFAAFFAWARRSGNPGALGAWLLFAVAAWFNPVSQRPALWIAPVATTLAALAAKPWKGFSPRGAVLSLSAALAASAAVCGALYAAGSRSPERGFEIAAGGGRVCVKDARPSIWIVDDGKALGGVLSCKEIRGWYVYSPDSPGVGYVRDVEALPEEGISRLVLGGEAGAWWMDSIARKIKGGGRMQLPRQVVFISPPFPPSALPREFVEQCNAKIVVGEFAARCEPEYADPPDWTAIVPGMELYIPAWMEIATFVPGEETVSAEDGEE